MLACFLPVRLAALAYGAYGSFRARFALGWLLLVSVVATGLVPMLVLASPDAALSTLVIAWPWTLPLVATVAGAVATRAAFATLEREPAISPRHDPLETAAYALLANTLIDACLVVVAALGAFVVSRTEL